MTTFLIIITVLSIVNTLLTIAALLLLAVTHDTKTITQAITELRETVTPQAPQVISPHTRSATSFNEI